MSTSRFATHRRARAVITAAILVIGVLTPVAASPASAAARGKGTNRAVAASGTASFAPAAGALASGVTNPEIPASPGGDGLAPDRSHSSGGGSTPVGAVTQPAPIAKSNPGLLASFDGINHFQQRFGSAGQFSLEPPDQGLCVGSDGSGNTRVLEVVNDTLRIYTTDGTAVTSPQGLNAFFGYAPAIVRTPTVTFGPFVTDPSCLFDAQTGHWILDVLTLDTFPAPGSDGQQHFTGTNHLDVAVSQTGDPTGSWNVYRIPVQDDGTDGTPNHHCQPGNETATPLPTNLTACFGDYPHLGSNSSGVYLTTNEYSFFGPEFHGAQIYAISKAQLTSGAASITVTQFDTHALDTFGFALNGFTLWPSTTPGGGGDPAAGGTEYFLSSNSAAEAHDTGDGTAAAQPSTQLLVWALTNTGSLDSSPDLTLSTTKLDVGQYSPPPRAAQKNGPQPLLACLNSNPCITALEGTTDPFTEKSSTIDANDSRMQQVTWVNGHLWGALDTGLNISSGTHAGIEWFNTTPSTSAGSVTATLAAQGYLGLGNDNLTYPAIGVTSGGTGVMAFTVLGNNFYPSAGYATVSDAGVGAVHLAAPGLGPDDGFSDYAFFSFPDPIRARWGDYGAAVPVGSNVWIASEYIGQSCNLSTYEKTSFRCGETRTALANWGTRISEVTAP